MISHLFTNNKTNCNIIRKSDAITNCFQIIPINEFRHFLNKRSTHTKTSTTSGEPKIVPILAVFCDYVITFLKNKKKQKINIFKNKTETEMNECN